MVSWIERERREQGGKEGEKHETPRKMKRVRIENFLRMNLKANVF